MKSILIKLLVIGTLVPTMALAQTLAPEDIQEYDSQTGIGCISKEPVTKKADYYHICKSKKSGEVAWNAALYRSKVACSSDEMSVHFNMSPSLPTKDGIHTAQVEVTCGKKP
ncbi:hypothetical protein DU002_10320 [Corallincola holothuriorum]|uniref:Uncharacterized protein n=1 Tax=Corallincola holothuriorum TaxID=2282215 RepID=A0A368NHS0_9GAMM|nr:hypothetical protein [Corallincola holothuriorum]RCU50008.1 hypothetical protein DU002_10320 [Corallincola holothuriorum]